ncbi:MAG TPA: adenylate/guanylate cyclase domain-containing protein [Vineibacter sp.]|nr:adenylate/guanylate cyclase domain-containing protein [Vineibacter sp.]
MNWRRLLPNIRYGTERYPENVARRLRAVNIACWVTALVPAYFAFVRFIDPERWDWGFLNLLFAVVIATIPLLHRFSSVAAPLALVLVVYVQIFRVVVSVGTGDGASLTYLSATVLFVLFIGFERVVLAAAMAVLAAGLMIWLHLTVPYSTGAVPTESLHVSFIVNVVMNTIGIFAVVYYAVRQAARAEAALEREYQRSELLLGNILPPPVAVRLKEREAVAGAGPVADRYDAASILFADMAGFTGRASDTAPDALVTFLDEVFTKLDDLVERHALEKIKTTGDAYMVVSGVPQARADHAAALADLALDMQAALAGLVDPKGRAVPVRIGIASGPVVAGIVGRKKFFYDVWGDAVNTAARMEQTAEPGTIQVAPQTGDKLLDDFELQERGFVEVRGKGAMRTWLLIARKRQVNAQPATAMPS